MKIRFSTIVVLLPLLVVVALLANYGEYIFKVPRGKVGPLQKTLSVSEPLRLFALGDTGTGGPEQLAVAQAMERRCQEHGVDGLLFLGDNIYQTGVSDTEDKQWQEKIWDVYNQPCLKDVPIYPVLGNHDYRDNPYAQIEYTLKNPRWHMPNRFYSVDFGYLLKVVAFDSNLSEVCFNPKFCSVDFLLSEIKKPTTIWRIVTAHHPLATASVKGYSHAGGMRGLIFKPLLCDDVDLWIAGHAHHLEYRSLPECRLDLVVSGAGGADLYQVHENDDYDFAASKHGFVELHITKEEMQMRFIDKGGNLLHEVRKTPNDD